MTLEQIRAALPKYIIIAPEYLKNTQQKGDIVYGDSSQPIDSIKSLFYLRPIPPHILDNQAFWLWRGQFGKEVPLTEDFSLAEFDAHTQAGRLYDKWLLEQMGDV